MKHYKHIFVLICLSWVCVIASAQKYDSLQLNMTKDIDVFGTICVADHLNNIYVVKRNTITKLSSNGEQLAQYTDMEIQDITSIDASNPQRILVFGRDHNLIRFLDKNLSELGSPLKLDQINSTQTIVASNSYKDGFWIYSANKDKLIYINSIGQTLYESNDIKSFVNTDIQPNFIIERNERIYMNVPDTGILIFDQYATFQEIIPITNLHNFLVFQDNLYYCQDGQLASCNLSGTNCNFSQIPSGIQNGMISMSNDYFFIFYIKKIYIFRYK